MFAMLRGFREALICVRDTVSICFMCRSMDQMPAHNIGKACTDYYHCIVDKCFGCCHTNGNVNNVELAGDNNAEVEGQV